MRPSASRLGSAIRGGRSLSVLDQAVSSLSNFVLTISVARVSSPAEFGQFALASTIFVFFLGLARAGVGEVLLVAYSRSARAPGRWASRPIGAALVLGVGCAVVTLAVGAVVGRSQPLLWAIFAVTAAVVIVQDTARHVSIVSHRPGHALLLDTIWAVASVGPMLVLSLLDAQPEVVVLAWAVGALLSVAHVLQTYRRPRIREGVRWVATNGRLARVFSGEYAMAAAANTVVWFFLIPPLGEAGIGSVRGVLVLFSPLNTLFSAITLAALPELVRAVGAHQMTRRLAATFGITVAIALGWSVLVIAAPAPLGEALIGGSWQGASDLRWAAAVHHVMIAVYTVLVIAFRATRLTRQSSAMRTVSAVCSLALPVALAVPFQAMGASWGFALAMLASVVIGVAGMIVARRVFRPAVVAATDVS